LRVAHLNRFAGSICLPSLRRVESTTGPNPALRFPGQWFQSETSLNQNWMRDYEPNLGRYLQADPLGLVDGASVYGYVGQNPGRFTDPTGEFAVNPITI
jgi:RHS repeat-associated protein